MAISLGVDTIFRQTQMKSFRYLQSVKLLSNYCSLPGHCPLHVSGINTRLPSDPAGEAAKDLQSNVSIFKRMHTVAFQLLAIQRSSVRLLPDSKLLSLEVCKGEPCALAENSSSHSSSHTSRATQIKKRESLTMLASYQPEAARDHHP